MIIIGRSDQVNRLISPEDIELLWNSLLLVIYGNEQGLRICF